jgi:recombination protein RecR
VIERSGCFRGIYHVLGGRIVPLEGVGPEQLNMASLKQRVADDNVTEIIIATSSDVEGEATAAFIAEMFSGRDITLSRIAAGLPVGADLSYADTATVSMAMNARRSMR